MICDDNSKFIHTYTNTLTHTHTNTHKSVKIKVQGSLWKVSLPPGHHRQQTQKFKQFLTTDSAVKNLKWTRLLHLILKTMKNQEKEREKDNEVKVINLSNNK